MPDNNPEGIVSNDSGKPTQSGGPHEPDELLDAFLSDPEEDTAQEGDEPGPDEDGADVDASSDEADDAATPDGEQPRDEKGRFLSDDARVRLDNGDVVTLKDLKQGSLRQADYTRKTQEVATQRRDYEERNRRVEQLETQLAQDREWTLSVLQSVMPTPPDTAELAKDPIGYMQRKAAYDENVARYNALYAQSMESLNRQRADESARLQQTFREGQQKLRHELVPELKDEGKFNAFRQDVIRFGTEVYGFTQEELGGLTDPRVFHGLSDAIKWRKLQQSKGKTTEKTQGRPPVTPGRRQEPQVQKVRATQKDRQTLKSTGGRGRDGQAALDRLLDKYV